MEKTLLLIVVILMLLLAFSISASAEEYTDSLTITDAEAEFFELTDDDRAKFSLEKPRAFKMYRYEGDIIELLSQCSSIDDIMNQMFDENDYIWNNLWIVIRNEVNNRYRKKSYNEGLDSVEEFSYFSSMFNEQNYIVRTDNIQVLEGLNISKIYCIRYIAYSDFGGNLVYYVTDKGDYAIILSDKIYFMPASALFEVAQKALEDRKNRISYDNLLFTQGTPGIRKYMVIETTPTPTPDVEPTLTPDVEITPTPTPTPMPPPTPSVTITPSSKPTDKTTPIPPPTISPSETTAPSTETTPTPTPVEKPSSPVLWIVLGTAAVILLGAVGVLVIRRKK